MCYAIVQIFIEKQDEQVFLSPKISLITLIDPPSLKHLKLLLVPNCF